MVNPSNTCVSGLQNYVILCVNAIEIMVWGNVEVPIKTCV